MNKIKVLFITPTAIADGTFGGALRSRNLRSAMLHFADVDTVVVRGGHQLRADETWNAERVREFVYSRQGLSVAAIRQLRLVRRWVGSIVDTHAYDVIVARYFGQAVFVPNRAWSRLIIDADDLHKTVDVAESSVVDRLRTVVRNLVVLQALRRARHVWVVNPSDRHRLPPNRVSLVENTVAVPSSMRQRRSRVPGRVLMVGLFSHPPNAQGLTWFTSHVLSPLRERYPGVELHAVGKFPPALGEQLGGRVVMRGFVDDVSSEYDQASLVIAPIATGAGSQIKVIDALVHGRPLVASRFAHSAFSTQLLPLLHLRVAETAAEWIENCEWILRQTDEAERMAARGGEVARTEYGLQRMTQSIRSTFMHIVEEIPDRKF